MNILKASVCDLTRDRWARIHQVNLFFQYRYSDKKFLSDLEKITTFVILITAKLLRTYSC